MNSPDDQQRDLQAGEYVIGTLPYAERVAFAKLIESDPDIQRRVVWWETRLAHLDRNLVSVEPPAHVWQNILERVMRTGADSSAGGASVVDIHTDNQRGREHQQSLSGWRGLAALATAACMILAITLWFQQVDPRRSADHLIVSYDGISIVTGDDNAPLWVIDASLPDKQLRVTAVAPPALEPGKAYELWMVKENDQGVSSMGLLPLKAAQSIVMETPSLGEEGIAFAVSLEPAGGSPEPVPTGPVLYMNPIQKLTTLDSI